MESDGRIFILANACYDELKFELPPETCWKRIVDTAQPTPADFTPEEQAPILPESICQVQAHSVVILCEAKG